MAGILLTVVDIRSADPVRDALLPKKHEVVTIISDTIHEWRNGVIVSSRPRRWGRRDLTAPFFRILDVPGVSHDNPVLQHLKLRESEVDETAKRPRRRIYRLNFASPHLPPAILPWLANDARPEPIFTIEPDILFRDFGLDNAKAFIQLKDGVSPAARSVRLA